MHQSGNQLTLTHSYSHKAKVKSEKRKYALSTLVALDVSDESHDDSSIAHVAVWLQKRIDLVISDDVDCEASCTRSTLLSAS